MKVFHGDPLDFQQWLISFEKLIEEMTDDPVRRLHYLGQYTAGDANTLVAGYSLGQTDLDYQNAKAELKREFGKPFVLARAYIDKIERWPTVKTNDGDALSRLSIFLTKCKGSMASLRHLQQLNTDLYLQKIVSKLPYAIQREWCKHVGQCEDKNENIDFGKLVSFIEKQARIVRHPVYSAEALVKAEGSKSHVVHEHDKPASGQKVKKSMATKVTLPEQAAGVSSSPVNSVTEKFCLICNRTNHELDECRKYLAMPLTDRKQFLFDNKLCFACCKPTSAQHTARNCRQRKTCSSCGRLHPTSLHSYRHAPRAGDVNQSGGDVSRQSSAPTPRTSSHSDDTEVKTLATSTASEMNDGVSMSIVKVRLMHKSDQNNVQTVYAALDSLSSACFIDKEVWSKLESPGVRTNISVRTITDERQQEVFAVDGLCVQSVDGESTVQLPKTYTQDCLPVNRDEIPSHALLRKYSHLNTLLKEMPDRDDNIPIGLLIGANCAKALEPHQVIPSVDDGPFAVKTALGWCVSGPADPDVRKTMSNCRIMCHRISAVEDVSLKDMIVQMYENDFGELMPNNSFHAKQSPNNVSEVAGDTSLVTTEKCALSHEDRQFLAMIKAEIKLIDGHYECPLPFRHHDVVMPSNRAQAVHRANGLKKRFARDEKFEREYKGFMKRIIDKNYARLAPDPPTPQRSWYLPHHAVYHPQKPDKIRVVFDCSCQYAGACLNKELLQGPNMMNSLIGVLTRFRQERVAFIADIESMFYQVRIPESQQDYVRFVWWPDGNTDAELTDFQMQVHLFGGISSPSCANFALRKTADDNEAEFGPEAANTLRKNFYVDDLLKSKQSTESSVELISAVRQMCKAGGFHLTKFVSNDRRVLESMSVEDRSKGVRNLNFSQEALPVERALGVYWCVENDTLGFRISLQDKPLTRRGVLSTVSSIYDPLGLASPFLLEGRRILQRLCVGGADWDDFIPDHERALWEKWRLNLPSLEHIEVSRCVKPEEFGEVVSVSLHHFSDASQEGYGQCSYLRLVDNHAQIHCTLLLGKSRVPPVKPVTVPRLELTAATISVKVASLLKSELEYNCISEFYWTDSRVVLGYIKNDVRRFHVFVANRVQLIRSSSDVTSWRYVDTNNNPADDASRGLDCSRVSSSHRWFNGADFLWSTEQQWPQDLQGAFISDDDAEVRRPKVSRATNVTQVKDLVTLLEVRISDWRKLKTLVSVWLMFFEFLRNNRTLNSVTLTVELMQRAEIEIIKSVQRRAFAAEIEQIKAHLNTDCSSADKRAARYLKRASPLYRLNPFVDEQGILRVGGRLPNSDFSEEIKHPVILPKSAVVTSLIVRWCHEQVSHSGRGLTLNEVRTRGYWIIQANSFVRSFIFQCIRCRALRGKTGEQLMSDLPADRVNSAPPFTYCAVDLFGPFIIREGRRELKRYGCLFTCLACRAVHIETTNSLDTDSFINALRRLIARRGEIRELRSDQATNFVGADTELQKALQEMNHELISRYLQQNGADYKYIVWKRNPPFASHMGGVWERQIRSVRSILSSLLKDHGSVLDDELFRTLLIEVEAVINSRPLTTETLSDPNSTVPLSPINLLTMKSKIVMPPPGCFQRTDLYCRRRWRRVQHLTNEFWSRWKKEYLTSLQPRSKNCSKRRNFQVGDIVLLKEADVSRNSWPLARIVDIHCDDGQNVRSVRLLMATSDDFSRERTFRERPIDRIVLLLESS